ncbi:hypothetical protein [Methylorubrum sp. DB1722]|uniref:hypothetical protein n=1 Tax=Methylorubrum sp. DB1722 TaxID=2478916 RepID=UPI0018E2E787|nr:hypothetical protein [Methylorubrum sp. DB1722]MBI1689484.1 hypothetical protein [Methylorubrum sp. DB1722]
MSISDRQWAIAQALFDRFIDRGNARLGGSAFRKGERVQDLVHSYRQDFLDDAAAVMAIVDPRLVAFEARAKAAERALVGLTPDGSEFYRRNPDRLSESEFIVDVSACLTHIHDTRERTRQSLVEANRSRAEAVSELRSARFRHEQATRCAGCGERKHTPLRVDDMGGYVCLTCIDTRLHELLAKEEEAA